MKAQPNVDEAVRAAKARADARIAEAKVSPEIAALARDMYLRGFDAGYRAGVDVAAAAIESRFSAKVAAVDDDQPEEPDPAG